MNPRLVCLPLAAAVALAAMAIGAPHRPDREGGAPGEVARLRTHFAEVIEELEARDLSALPPAQRAARARSVEALREYAAAGVFPHNHHFTERRPFFVDDHGTPCAMAYLIARSGREDLVRKVAATRNNALVRELADDPELAAWLDANGLTVHEAGRIQPEYQFEEPEEREASAAYQTGSAAATAVNALAILLNMGSMPPSPGAARGRGMVGVGTGIAGMALGAAGMTGGEEHRSWGIVNLAVGAFSTVLGVSALLPDGDAPDAEAAPKPAPGTLTLAAAPMVSARGAGVHVSLRF